MDRIQEIATATPVDPTTSLDCATTPTSTSPAAPVDPGPIDGTYTSNVTEEDLAAAGVPAMDIVPESWGESVLVFDHGRFATTQHNEQSCTWAFGRFSVDGDTLTFNYQGGGGQAPTGAANTPGEKLAFHWSLYRDVLTLTNQPDAVSPVPEGAQWELNRVSTAPDPSALNQQCPPPAGSLPN
jgi:hypothetical protein